VAAVVVAVGVALYTRRRCVDARRSAPLGRKAPRSSNRRPVSPTARTDHVDVVRSVSGRLQPTTTAATAAAAAAAAARSWWLRGRRRVFVRRARSTQIRRWTKAQPIRSVYSVRERTKNYNIIIARARV